MVAVSSLEKAYRIHVSLENSSPLIWRELIVPGSFSLGDLHEAIQIAMDWDDDHLHCFRIKGQLYEPLRQDPFCDDSFEERGVELSSLPWRKGFAFTYEYDFGDGWKHCIRCLETIKGRDGVATATGGERAAPPEDCGGVWRYAHLLDSWANGDAADREEAEMWLGDDFDPDFVDLDAINKGLARLSFEDPAAWQDETGDAEGVELEAWSKPYFPIGSGSVEEFVSVRQSM